MSPICLETWLVVQHPLISRGQTNSFGCSRLSHHIQKRHQSWSPVINILLVGPSSVHLADSSPITNDDVISVVESMLLGHEIIVAHQYHIKTNEKELDENYVNTQSWVAVVYQLFHDCKINWNYYWGNIKWFLLVSLPWWNRLMIVPQLNYTKSQYSSIFCSLCVQHSLLLFWWYYFFNFEFLFRIYKYPYYKSNSTQRNILV